MRRFAYISLAFFSALFTESLLSDFVYSDCIAPAAHPPSCTFGVQALIPLTMYHGHWLLSLISTITHFSIPDTMGSMAGIGFTGIFFMVFVLKGVNVHGFLSSILVSGFVYFLAMLGFIRWMPYCIAINCRVTNYLPFISYTLGFELTSFAWAIALLLYSWNRIWKK